MKYDETLFANAADAFKIGISYLIGFMAAGSCLYAAWTQGSADGRYIQVLICILGGTIGWIIGVYITPSSEVEKKQFTEFGKTLTALASGFGLAKIQDVIEWIKLSAQGLNQETSLLQILIFSCTLLIFGLFTYISRLHVRGSQEELGTKREKVLNEMLESIETLKRLA